MAAAAQFSPAGGTIVEVGSSQANMSLLLAEQGFFTIPLDNSLQALQYAILKHERGHIAPITGDALHMPLTDASADVMILAEVLEHIPDPHRVLTEMHRIIKPGGTIVVTTPNAGYIGEALPDYKEGLKPATDELGPDGAHHLYAFSHRSISKLASSVGLKAVAVGYVGSIIHCRLLRWCYSIFPVHYALSFGRFLNSIPGARHALSQTCVVMLQRDNANASE